MQFYQRKINIIYMKQNHCFLKQSRLSVLEIMRKPENLHTELRLLLLI